MAFVWGAEEIFVEPVNSRGKGLILTKDALRSAGFYEEANAVGAIRSHENWSHYALQLLRTLQEALRRRSSLDKLRFLLYPSNLSPNDRQWARAHSEGVRWLGEEGGE